LGKKVSKYCSKETIETFKERQELLKTIPESILIRTKEDESYREGWLDAAGWIQKRMNEIFHKSERSGIVDEDLLFIHKMTVNFEFEHA
jgi:hypothetical protein